MDKITVSAESLRQVLQALNGPGHHIRELQATRGPLVGDNNPINILVNEFNQAVDSASAAAAQVQIESPSDAVLPQTADELFAQWLAREMPANTVIGDPAWWAPRIKNALLYAEKVGLSSPMQAISADDLTNLMTAEEFESYRETGAINSDDGTGYWATSTQSSPLDVLGTSRPKWATHVMWLAK